MAKEGDIDYEVIVKMSEGFSGADLRNVCTEAGESYFKFCLVNIGTVEDFVRFEKSEML